MAKAIISTSVWFMSFIKQWTIYLLLVMSGPVSAFFPVLDSGRLLYQERQEISAHSHFVFAEKGLEFNVLTFFDELLSHRKDINIRYALGFGYSGLFLGPFLKYVPFPDYQYQPAVGVSTGVLYHPSDSKTHSISLMARPLISKDITTIIGKFTPYMAFPLSVQITNFKDFKFPVRMALGLRGELFFIHFRKIDLNIEGGFSLQSQGASYFSVGLITNLRL